MAVFTDIVTIYNHYTEAGDDKWQRTVLKDAQWRQKSIKTVTSDGKIAIAEVVSITIPNRGGYLAPSEWLKGQKAGYWTLNAKNNLDIAVYGECFAEITATYGLKQLKKDYGGVTISSVADNTIRDGLKHWRAEAV